MRYPSLKELPPPPPGKSGWPWTEETLPLADDTLLPRVSIVTPSYNQVEFIEETIRSVLLQGCPNLEYIIMDGGSTDGSVDIIRKYEPWLTFWVSERDHGQTNAINTGWKHATGDIFAYINSDDYYLPRAVASVIERCLTNPQVGLIYGSAAVIDETGNELRTWQGKKFDLKTMLVEGSIVPQPAAFFSKNALQDVGHLDERWQMIMDYELCIRVGLQFPTLCIPKIIAKFRDHSRSKTHRHFDSTANELINWSEAFCPKQIPPKQLKAMKREMLSRIHFEWALNYLGRGRKYSSQARRQLIQSLLKFPQFAFKHPAGIAYIIKEILLSHQNQITFAERGNASADERSRIRNLER